MSNHRDKGDAMQRVGSDDAGSLFSHGAETDQREHWPPNDKNIDQRFAEFDAKHPEVWNLFVQKADLLRRRGHKAYSSDAILHAIRWHYAVNEQRDEGFKINDHFSSRYARKLMATDPTYEGFFQLRELRERA